MKKRVGNNEVGRIAIEGVSKGMDAAQNLLIDEDARREAMKTAFGMVDNYSKMFFKGRSPSAKMKKYQLPGDTELLHRYDYTKNPNPCIFLPAFLMIFFVDGM